MEIKLDFSVTPLNLEHTLQCGQLFRWEKIGDYWYGIVREKVIKIRQNAGSIDFQIFPSQTDTKFIRSYFRLDDDLPHIFSKIKKDEIMKKAINLLYGLRITRQEPWECLISYICATYKNIPAIRRMIQNLSQQFGKEIRFENHIFYTFPKPSDLARAGPKELENCGLGFRANYVLESARTVENERFDLEALRKMDYEEAKRELLSFLGVGNKVADCILLFSLDKLEAFPVDIWIKRIILEFYSKSFSSDFVEKTSEKNSLTNSGYLKISKFGRSYFGAYAGYAQEYLFHWKRLASTSGTKREL
jgi:N-glycosylase/DNA lyase